MQNKKVFIRIESMPTEVPNQQKAQRKLKPLTQEQLIERANQSNSDYLSGNVKAQEELEQGSENWYPGN